MKNFSGSGLAFALVVGATYASAQQFPAKPIRIMCSLPGGGSDFAARIIATGISGPLGQPVIVDNRSGIIAQEVTLKAPPDGYTLIVDGASLWIAPLVQKAPYETLRDFTPVILVSRQPAILVVHPSLPVKSLKDLIALAKRRPGDINYASGNPGSVAHLSGEMLNFMAGVSIVRVNYKGTGPALNDLLGGHIQMMFVNTGSAVTAHMQSGKLRAIAVTTAQPSPLVPGVPTMAASGLPGFETGSGTGVFAPGNTPAAIVNRLNQEIGQLLQRPEIKEKFVATSVEVVGNSPQDFVAAIKSDMTRIGKLVKDAGIKGE